MLCVPELSTTAWSPYPGIACGLDGNPCLDVRGSAVTVTSGSSCAIDAGALYCFGSNAEGKLANPIGLRPMPVLNVSALE